MFRVDCDSRSSIMAAPFDPIQAAFDNAVQDFKTDLGNDELIQEISKTSTIDQIYDATDALQKDQHSRKHMRCLAKIEPFLRGLREYTAVIEVFIQSKQDVLCLIWGPIKLLLQWTDNITKSFDSIINITAELGSLLPEFKAVGSLFRENPIIKDVLVLFFRDVLDFYLIALKFFSQSRWRIVFEAVWPKQRERIKIVATQIQRHTLLLRKETLLEHIQQAHAARLEMMEDFEKKEKSFRKIEYDTIATNVSPRSYGHELYRLQGEFCDGTEKWLMSDATFRKWLDAKDLPTQTLWIQGIPGAGKTLLTSAKIAETQKTGKVIYAFLSYKFASSLSALSILHSLIFQLAADRDDLQEIVCQSSSETLKSSIEAATELLKTLVHYVTPVYIVIDGIDEIDELERGRLLKHILSLLKTDDRASSARVCISSRIETDLTRMLKDWAIIRVDHHNAGSIQKFVNQCARQWYSEDNISPEMKSEIEGLLAPLASHAKGMFLYARVVLSSIRSMQTTDEIRNYLRVPPKDLGDAYARILQRIHDIRPIELRQKALQIIGWVGSTPTPLATYELEQALLVSQEDGGFSTQSVSRFDVYILRLCGPIVEIIEEYVQYVHFTVKEYVFDPKVPGSICGRDATLSLATCLVTYLCQMHHDPDLPEEDVSANVTSGVYRLHNLAASIWLETIESYLQLKGSQTLDNTLTDALDMLVNERVNDMFISSEEPPPQPRLGCFKSVSVDMYRMLCEIARFRKMSQKGGFNKAKDSGWSNHDPLTISRTSVRIFEQFDQLILYCERKNHENCKCVMLRQHYGQRPFKCGFVGCSFQRHGFESHKLRASHMKHHDRPWKCSVDGCEFADGGFLSRKMRDEHLDKYHVADTTKALPHQTPLDTDDIQPLLFDLVRADNVDAMRELLPSYDNLPWNIRRELRDCAAYSGSPTMIDMLFRDEDYNKSYHVTKAIQGLNLDVFKHLLGRDKSNMQWYLGDVLDSESEPVFEIWRSYLDLVPLDQYFFLNQLSKVHGNPEKESLFIYVWEKVRLERGFTAEKLGKTLVDVARTACSVRLAKYLVDHGADVNYARPGTPKPLRHASRHNSATAAELMKFLLLQGADPDPKPLPPSRKRLQDEKGPKSIAKWLGISWDELVAQTREERERERAIQANSATMLPVRAGAETALI
ncbi:hypothetical protein PV04_07539 [Phialophora macrospora]|uniref:NACHT domain-containing protein n=1 Tax=Phialophora macrospora TaxID=1851006 RepID=A0A0D2CJ37_9EURO|nr:hypothetical protein PV04_07539 [Phialophora macrospora]